LLAQTNLSTTQLYNIKRVCRGVAFAAGREIAYRTRALSSLTLGSFHGTCTFIIVSRNASQTTPEFFSEDVPVALGGNSENTHQYFRNIPDLSDL